MIQLADEADAQTVMMRREDLPREPWGEETEVYHRRPPKDPHG